jgi:predicted DNA-binding transcriptional regulator AlpA
MIERLMNIKELAEILAIKPQTIRNKLSRGKFEIPTYKIGGKLVWKESEVLSFIKKLERIN